MLIKERKEYKMRILSKKAIISFLGVLLLSVVAFSAVSLMFADEENGALEVNLSKGADNSTSTSNTFMTMIDWIIEISNSTEDGIDTKYHILELDTGSKGKNQSPLKKMIDSIDENEKGSIFEKYVLDGHKSDSFDKTFKTGNIDYDYKTCTGITPGSETESEVLAAIANADFIYLTEDPDALWDEDNDITTSIQEKLYDYAVNNKKPIVIDSHNITTRDLISGGNTVKDVVAEKYIPNGNNYNTYKWPHDTSINGFMNPADMKYVYVPIHGDSQSAKWSKVSYKVPILDDNGNQDYEKDDNGNPIVEKDEDGNPIVEKDEDGNPVYELDSDGNKIPEKDSNNNIVYETDSNGDKKIELDENNLPKIEKDDEGNNLYELDAEGNKIQDYERNADGSFVLDENNEKILAYEKDENGNYVVDGDNNQIPIYMYKYVYVPKYKYKYKYKLKYDVTETPDYLARILTIHNSSVNDDNYLTKKLKDCCTEEYKFEYENNSEQDVQVELADGFTKDGTILRLDKDSDLYKYGYYGREMRPTAFKFEDVDIKNNDGLEALKSIDFSKFDFIVLELSTKDIDLSKVKDSKLALITAMTSNTHLLYDGSISNGSINNGSSSASNAAGYNALINYIAPNDVPKYASVLVTSKKNFTNYYSTAKNAEAVDDIARIINSGDFRGYSGSSSGGTSVKYTVLEIEPCYPIDIDLAKVLKSKGAYGFKTSNDKAFDAMTGRNEITSAYDTFYYMKPHEVSSKTSDEISYFSDTYSLTELLENKSELEKVVTEENFKKTGAILDYYKWHISPAKIAHATGKSIDSIEVVHMSSSEFAASRKKLMESYDAIYIGGDNSAIKPADKWYSKSLNQGYNYYDMYFHSGDLYQYPSSLNNSYNMTYGVLPGNDITKNKLDELKEYAKQMPVILERSLCDAYLDARSKGSSQHVLDPDSNIYKLLEGITSVNGSKLSYSVDDSGKQLTNVLVNFDYDYTYKAQNNNNEYGNETVNKFATVFLGGEAVPEDAYDPSKVNINKNKVGETDLTQVLVSAERPLLTVYYNPQNTTSRQLYDVKDEASWVNPDDISSEGLKWKAKLSNSTDNYAKVTYKLFIDDDSDGKFDENEELFDTKSSLGNVTLSFKPQSDYYGVVYWKILVTTETRIDADGNFLNTDNVIFRDSNGVYIEKGSKSTPVKTVILNCVQDGRFKIKKTPKQSKMYVNLLQVMPKAGKGEHVADGSKNTSRRSLFFCTECQYAKDVLLGTAFAKVGINTEQIVGGQNSIQEYDNSLGGVEDTSQIVSVLNKYDSSYQYKGSVLGSHTHDFGITEYDIHQTYNKKVGADNVESNLFDYIRNDYDVDETILFTDEFDEKIQEVIDIYKNLNSTGVDDLIKSHDKSKDIYKKRYEAMKAIINGKVEGYTNTYHVNDNGVVSLDVTKFDTDFPGFRDTLNTYGISNQTINEYVNSSYAMDSVLKSADYGGFDMEKIEAQNRQSMIDNITSDKIARDMRKYHHMFGLTADTNVLTNAGKFPTKYKNNYWKYRDAKILENFFFDEYQDHLWKASYDADKKNVDLHNIYGCIALGAALYFGGDDLDYPTLDALENYIKKDGNIFLFKDSLNAEHNATTRMTERLSSLFGMNARHMSVGPNDVSKKTLKDKTVKIYVNGASEPSYTYNLKKDISFAQLHLMEEIKYIKPTDVKYSIGEFSDTINDYTNDDLGYDIKLKKSPVQYKNIPISVYYYQNQWNIIKLSEFSIKGTDTDVNVVLGVQDGDSNFYNGMPTKTEITSSGSQDKVHDINISIDIQNFDSYSNPQKMTPFDSNKSYYIVVGDDNNQITFTDNSSFTINSMEKADYELISTTKKTVTGTEKIKKQLFDVTVVDDSDPAKPLENETITYTIDSKTNSVITDADGKATFERLNYEVTGYKESGGAVSKTDSNQEIDDQGMRVYIYDVNKKPVEGVDVSFETDGYALKTLKTDNKGLVEFNDYKNYVEVVKKYNYNVDAGYSDNTYFMSNIAGIENSNISLSPWMLTTGGIFKQADKGGPTAADKLLMFKHATLNNVVKEEGQINSQIGANGMMEEISKGLHPQANPTDYVEQNNIGIITMYPFSIGPDVHISVTAPVDYALDIEDDDVVVYYTLAGGTLGTGSALFAADAKDGQSNYFIYQKGNITYTGAGHGNITGFDRDNNFERMLFINVIVNSGKKSLKGPAVSLYDLKDTDGNDITTNHIEEENANNTIKKFSDKYCDYYTEIEDETEFEGFNYFPSVPSGTLDKVRIYYNANHTEEVDANKVKFDDSNGNNDVLIFEYDRDKTSSITPIANDLNKMNDQISSGIALSKDRFDPKTNNEFAYIVVEIENSAGQKASTVLRIQYKTELIDLN